MKKNNNLHNAKKEKNDEFYTQLTDIENELKNYKKFFKNKVVFCNCDDPQWSNFWNYFAMNFEHLGLKKLISTHYEPKGSSYKQEITHDVTGDGKINNDDTVVTPLTGNGDFRSEECLKILKEADIVVTNPPFSLFREYVALLMEHKKKFLIVGSQNAITYKEVFKHIKNNELWLGTTAPKVFIQPDKTEKKFGNICWFTNIPHKKRNEELILWKPYKGNEKDYPKYDNYDAIEVSKTKEIPMDYKGIMGVPITFLDKYNPEQFEIVNMSTMSGVSANYWTFINGNPKYARIFIRNRKL